MFDYLKCKGFSRVFKAKNQFPESSGNKGCIRLLDYFSDDKVIKAIFDHVRNIGISVTPLVVGYFLLSQNDLQYKQIPWLNYAVSFSLFILSVGLFALNTLHGFKKILELVKTSSDRLFEKFGYGLMVIYLCIEVPLYVFSLFLAIYKLK
ncbi:MAG: hypothetical protein ABL933_06200 [Methyloglobulus sp.]|nr:hypothetical protein [Methyloglobulus sp.]